jgi:hypothetical protein
MGIGVSLLLIAAGAILAFAVNVTGNGFNVHTIGIILLVVGAIGALLSMIFWSVGAASAAAAAKRSSRIGTTRKVKLPAVGRISELKMQRPRFRGL